MTILRYTAFGLVLAGLSVYGLAAIAQQFDTPATTPSATAPCAGAPSIVPPRLPGPGSAGGTVVVETLPGGGKVLRATAGGPAGSYGPGGVVFGGNHPQVIDPDSAKLLSAEHAAAHEARELTQKYQAETSEEKRESLKAALKDKLKQVFDLQQARRTKEVERIEERLGKLKDAMKKREAAKDDIIGRRLDELTGGVDALGWEESLPVASGGSSSYSMPGGVPGYPAPRFIPETTPRSK